MSTYQFDGQVVRTQDGEYVCEVIAFEPELMGKLLEHPFAKRLREAGPQIAAEVDRMMAATPSEDGGEVPEVVGWRVCNPRTKKTRFYGASKGYLMEGFQNVGYQTEAVTTVAQHSRIVAAKDAEIAEWKLRCQYNADTAHDVAVERDELRAALLKVSQDGDKLRAELQAQPARQVGEYGDAYQGAREDLAIWKRRALEAEATLRQKEQIVDSLVLEAQGETRMGEPLISVARQVGGDELRVVFDGPPGPECGRFVEVENVRGESINAGEWRQREDGLWELVIARAALAPAAVCVMPERKEYPSRATYPDAREFDAACLEVHVWNTLLDKVARLNRNPIPVELLARVAYLLELGEMDGPTARELRALLARQQEAAQ